MMKYRHNKLFSLVASIVLILFSGSLFALDLTRKLTNADCRVIGEMSQDTQTVAIFSDALLWKVAKGSVQSNYVFGTIHVSDPKITNLPETVKSALRNSEIFVMEALPLPEEALLLSQMMFYTDGTTLKDYLDDDLFNRTVKVLSNFQLSIEAVSVMRPWAAFLMMNYPPGNTMPLDLKLFEIATSQGARTIGLETLSEQGAVFSKIALDNQFRLLLDTVCNYDLVIQNIEEMKRLYLKKDLNGLFNLGTQHAYADEQVYRELSKRLLTDRNKIMVDRMETVLQGGDAFIAIGALHLPGNEGVIARLREQGYKITAIY